MPISIYTPGGEQLALLCEHEWELAAQLTALEDWVRNEGALLPPGDYRADLGFTTRREATGGGGTLSSDTLSTMGKIGMSFWLSEYGIS